MGCYNHNLQDVQKWLLQYHAGLAGHSRGTAIAIGNLTGQCHTMDRAQHGKMIRPNVLYVVEDIICLLLAIEP
jgi:hypothetical protein